MSTGPSGSTVNYYNDKDQTCLVANIAKSTGTTEYSYSYQPSGVFRSNTGTANFMTADQSVSYSIADTELGAQIGNVVNY